MRLVLPALVLIYLLFIMFVTCTSGGTEINTGTNTVTNHVRYPGARPNRKVQAALDEIYENVSPEQMRRYKKLFNRK